MGKINFYSARALFKGDPKNLTQLRDAQLAKLGQYKESGTFAFTMEADDKQPAAAISWKGDADNKDYWKTVVKAPKQIKGTFAANAKAKSYAFTTDDGSKALIGEYLKLKDNAVSIAMWNLIGPEANLISINGTALTRRTLSDATWTLAKWDVGRVLVSDNSLFDKAPIPGTVECTQDGKKYYKLPHRLLIPQDLTITIEVFGKIVQKAQQNEHSAAYVRDKVADVFKPMVEKLAKDLLKIDESIGKEKDRAKKLKLVEQCNQIFEKFDTDAEKALLASAQEQWIKLLEAKVDYRDFQVDMAVKITRGVVVLAVSVTVAGVGGISGVGAILGLVGTIKGGLETADTIYTAFRDVDGMGNEINTLLASALASKNAAGWKDFGKTVLVTLPGGKVVASALARGGLAVKPVKDIKKDIEIYNGKVSGLIKKASDLGKQVSGTLKKSQDALTALDATAVKDIEKTNPKVKARNEALRKSIGKATTEFLDKIGDLTKRFEDGKKKVEKYAKLVELLEQQVNEDVFATALRDCFTPLLNLPWGMNPENLANTIISGASVALEVVAPLIALLTDAEETTEETTEWVKTGLELTRGIREIMEGVKKLHEATGHAG